VSNGAREIESAFVRKLRQKQRETAGATARHGRLQLRRNRLRL